LRIGRPSSRRRARGGFTLIEVMGALVVFSVAVLMVVGVSGATATQMRYAGIVSTLALRASERLDSLDAQSFAGLVFGEDEETLTVGGIEYRETVTVTRLTPLLAQVEIDLGPAGGAGPTYALRSYVGAIW